MYWGKVKEIMNETNCEKCMNVFFSLFSQLYLPLCCAPKQTNSALLSLGIVLSQVFQDNCTDAEFSIIDNIYALQKN